MSLIHYFFLFMSLSFYFFGCGIWDNPEERVVLSVGEKKVTLKEFKKDLEFLTSGTERISQQSIEVREQIVQQVINRMLIIEHGRQNNIRLSEDEFQRAYGRIKMEYSDDSFEEMLLRGSMDKRQWEEQLRQQLLIEKIIDVALENSALPRVEEIERYYRDHENEFRCKKRVRFRQIVTQTKKEAEDLIRRLNNGENMEKLAREHSIAPESEKGGIVEWLADGQMDESMEKVLFSMPKNKISPIIKTPYGYHIFKVLSVKPAGMKKLPEVIQDIETKLQREKNDMYLKEWLHGLKNHIEVRVNHRILNTLEMS